MPVDVTDYGVDDAGNAARHQKSRPGPLEHYVVDIHGDAN
jgi:hypothetical protein